MVRAAPKPNLRDASCCMVVVRNGAYGLRVYGLASTEAMVNVWSASAVASAPARSSSRWTTSGFLSAPSSPKLAPVATRLPSTVRSFAGKRRGSCCSPASNVASRSQYDAERNAIRARSRSTTSRVATDCTRPADRPLMTFFQSTGLTS